MRKKELAKMAIDDLKVLYPEAKCSLNAKNPFELIVATRLSAQCTDARVNLVTPKLFEHFPTPEAMGNADIKDVEELIKSCGLYKTKAKDLVALGKVLWQEYNSELPNTLEELIKLPGIGRKTANLICGDVFGLPAVVADTHLIRITNRLGLVAAKEPKAVELALKKILPPDESNDFCHRIVMFGRDVCSARNPKCTECIMSGYCPKKINRK